MLTSISKLPVFLAFALVALSGVLHAQSEMPWTRAMCEKEKLTLPLKATNWGGDPQSALIKGIELCDYATAKRLIGSGMNVNFGAPGMRPLDVAIAFGENLVVEELLDHGADANATDKGNSSSTPLMGAAFGENSEAVRLLLAHGASVNLRDVYRATALMYAAEKGNSVIVKLLLAHGANPRLKDKFGHTARDTAITKGRRDAAEILKEAEHPSGENKGSENQSYFES
jgi:ankyrin repeat protein